MKRFVSMLLAVLLIAAVPSFAFAETDDAAEQRRRRESFLAMAEQQLREEMDARGYTEVKVPTKEVLKKAKVDPEVCALAYSDLENATPAQKEKILAARRSIIYKVDGWYDDMGSVYAVTLDNKTKTWESLPKFSELFPGWDVPTEETAGQDKASQEELKAALEKDLEEQGYTKITPITKRASLASINVAPSTRALAYADLKKATPARQQEILAARNEVIFSAGGWYDDQSGVYAVNIDKETKTYQELPKFSELFPNWDVPTEPAGSGGYEVASQAPSSGWYALFSGEIDVPKYVENVQSGIFFVATNALQDIVKYEVDVIELWNCTQINLGLTDMTTSTYKSLAWTKGVTASQSVMYSIDGNVVKTCGFRASAYKISNAEAHVHILGTSMPKG